MYAAFIGNKYGKSPNNFLNIRNISEIIRRDFCLVLKL